MSVRPTDSAGSFMSGESAQNPPANFVTNVTGVTKIIPPNIRVNQPLTPPVLPQVPPTTPQPPIIQPINLPTPVKIKKLNQYLTGYSSRHFLVSGFTDGFHLGIQGQISAVHPQNHKSALQNYPVVQDKISSELNLGRYAGPFSIEPLPDFIVSPLGLVPKKESGKFRLIHDLSFPNGSSVNSLIPPEFSSVHYDNIQSVISLVNKFGSGCLMSKADIEDAFRLIPIHPSDHKYLGFKWDNQFYYDRCLPMGCSSSCQIFESFSSALQWIMHHKFQVEHMSHLLDDFFFIGPGNSTVCHQNLSTFLTLCSDIGVPIKSDKTVHPTTVITIYGIEIDSTAMMSRLPRDKLEKAALLLSNLQYKRKVKLCELQSLIGFLNFACSVILPGRAFLRRLIDLTKGIARPHYYIRLTKEARADIRAWLSFLQSFNGKSCFLFDDWLSSDSIKLFSDAAGVHGGFAAVLGSQWFAGVWTDDLIHTSITVKELFPIVLAIEMWGVKLSNHKILFMCDNFSVVDILNKTSSKDPQVMILVRRLVLATLQHNIFFKAKHIPGFTNVVADRLSRFNFQEAFSLAPWLNKEPISIPAPLLTL